MDQYSTVLPDFDDQNYGDGKIELIGFNRAINLVLERALPGQGWRLGQVKGPFVLSFRQSLDKTRPLHNYMGIDGEYFDVIAPKYVKVLKCKSIPGGKIKVLANIKKWKMT